MQVRDMIYSLQTKIKSIPVKYGDTDLIVMFNEIQAEYEVAIRNQYKNFFLAETEVFDLIKDQSSYDLPSDCVSIKNVMRMDVPNGYPLKFLRFRTNIGYTSFDPIGWYIGNFVGNKKTIGIHPVPSADRTGFLKVVYVRSLAKMTDIEDTPELPESFHILLVKKAHIKILSDNGIKVPDFTLMDAEKAEKNALIEINKPQLQSGSRIVFKTNFGD